MCKLYIIVCAILLCETHAYLEGSRLMNRAHPRLYAGPRVGGFSNPMPSARRSPLKAQAMALDTAVEKPGKTKISLGAPFSGLTENIRRRMPLYASDWTDGLKLKSVSVILFLFFTCLAPTVAFGGLTNIITDGSIGVIEFILSCGISGVMYAILSGQPMAFVGPTGLTLAFITALYKFCQGAGLQFFPLYTWTGLWTSLLLSLISVFNLSTLITLCTRFTDECFNALLALNFLYEAAMNLVTNFTKSDANYASAFAALNLALATWMGTRKVVKLQKSNILSEDFRTFCSDFGPTIIIILMSVFARTPIINRIGIDYLSIPAKFALSGNRAWLTDLWSVPMKLRLMCLLPASLLSMLFYLDQNITVRTTESALNDKKDRKGGNTGFYHQDILVLAAITGVLSVLGLPWCCAATVQSLNHVRACRGKKTKNLLAVPISDVPKGSGDEDTAIPITNVSDVVDGVVIDSEGNSVEVDLVEDVDAEIQESRLTGFAIHSMILCSLFLLPLLSYIPIPVISGIFLYLGRKIMKGNLFFDRIGQVFVQKDMLPINSVYRKVEKNTVVKYVSIQATMLGFIWYLKSNKKYAIFFPSCIALLAFMRAKVLPFIFEERDLEKLDSNL